MYRANNNNNNNKIIVKKNHRVFGLVQLFFCARYIQVQFECSTCWMQKIQLEHAYTIRFARLWMAEWNGAAIRITQTHNGLCLKWCIYFSLYFKWFLSVRECLVIALFNAFPLICISMLFFKRLFCHNFGKIKHSIVVSYNFVYHDI